VRLEIIDSGQNRAFAYPGVDVVVILFAADSQEFGVLEEVRTRVSVGVMV
jgi:hypothetical protein